MARRQDSAAHDPGSATQLERVAADLTKPRRRSLRKIFGSLLVFAGIGVLAWSLVVWQWNDPFTSLYTRWQQRQLTAELNETQRRVAPVAVAPTATRAEILRAVKDAAGTFATTLGEGAPLGRIKVERLGLDMVMVFGTEPDTLKQGPGLHADTRLPGEGDLVYVAGHRTTYRAPFGRIDALRPGDRIVLELPYATIEYAVDRHTIVDDNDLSVLAAQPHEVLALQACHPRFFASQRYIVWARPVLVTTPSGAKARLRPAGSSLSPQP